MAEEILMKDQSFYDAKHLLASIEASEGNTSEAKKIYHSLTEIPEIASRAYHGLAYLELQYRKGISAYRFFKKSVEIDSFLVESYLAMASIDVAFKRYKRAKTVLDNGISLVPDWEEGIVFLALVNLLINEDINQFKSKISELAAIHPDNYHYKSMLGFLEVELKNYQAAVQLFHEVFDASVDSVQSGEQKFSTRLKKDQSTRRALNYYFENYEMKPKARELFDQGICTFISGDKNEAIRLMYRASDEERHPAIYNFIGSIYRTMLMRQDIAISFFNSALKLDSTNWRAIAYRAELYSGQKKLDSAYLDYLKFVELKPRHKEGYKQIGNLLLSIGKYPQAYRYFSKAIAIDPDDYDLFFNRSACATSLKSYQSAADDLEYIVKRKEDGEAYYYLHKARLDLNDSTKALIALDSASNLNPWKKIYHDELITWAEKTNDQALKLKALDRLVKRFSHQPIHRLNRAKFLLSIGATDKSIEDLQKFVKKRKNHGEGHYYLGKALVETGNIREGETHLSKSRKLGFKPK